MISQQEIFKTRQIVSKLFKNSKGEPFILTDGQAELFSLIYKKKYPRNHIETHTRYGKSDVVSMAVLLRVSTFPEKWVITAGNTDKARIIMQYAIGHIFDSDYTRSRFVMGKDESEEKIRRYRNKDRINFRLDNGKLGELFITTAAGALGFGAPNVIEDESGLIVTTDHALVMRMLGDQPENFLVEIGNPWPEEHFIKSFEDPLYHKLIIDYTQGVREGRLAPEYIDEMRKQPFFDVLYECKFPKEGIIDEKGWVPLFTKDEIDRAMIDSAMGFGINKLGIDVAGGGRNFSVIVQRRSNIAKVVHKTLDADTMNLGEAIIGLWKREKIINADIFIDKNGIGKGLYDLLNREITGIYGLNVGEKATSEIEEQRFTNMRAELAWKMREWILVGGKLERNEDWYQLTKLKYRVKLEGRRGKMQLISKEDLLKDGIQSPDVADALMMTFRTFDIPPIDEEVRERMEVENNKFDPFNPFPEI